MDEKFYETPDEQILANVISGLYNELVGKDENDFLDKGKDACKYFTKSDDISSLVLKEIMKAYDGYICSQYHNRCWILETSQLHSIGKQRIEEIVNHRVDFMFKKFPPEY